MHNYFFWSFKPIIILFRHPRPYCYCKKDLNNDWVFCWEMRTHQTQCQIQTQLNHSWIKLVYGKHVNQYTFRRRGGQMVKILNTCILKHGRIYNFPVKLTDPNKIVKYLPLPQRFHIKCVVSPPIWQMTNLTVMKYVYFLSFVFCLQLKNRFTSCGSISMIIDAREMNV